VPWALVITLAAAIRCFRGAANLAARNGPAAKKGRQEPALSPRSEADLKNRPADLATSEFAQQGGSEQMEIVIGPQAVTAGLQRVAMADIDEKIFAARGPARQ